MQGFSPLFKSCLICIVFLPGIMLVPLFIDYESKPFLHFCAICLGYVSCSILILVCECF